jgi:hypothetical protein
MTSVSARANCTFAQQVIVLFQPAFNAANKLAQSSGLMEY